MNANPKMQDSPLAKAMADAKNLLWVVTGLVISIIFLFLFGVVEDKAFSSMLSSIVRLSATMVTQIQFVIIISTIVYALLWAHNGLIELGAVEDWASPPSFIPEKRFLFILGSIFVGIFISLAIVVTPIFEYFAFAVIIYCLMDLVLWYARVEEMRKIIELASNDIKEEEKEINRLAADNSGFPEAELLAAGSASVQPLGNIARRLQRVAINRSAISALKRYYIDRPHYSRVLMEIGFATLAVMVFFKRNYITAQLQLDQITEERLQFISYFLIWLSFVVAEVVISSWRRSMHKELNSLKIDLLELERGMDKAIRTQQPPLSHS